GPASEFSGGGRSVERQAGEGPGEVDADGALHAPGLQREAAARAADQPVGAAADTEAGLARAADIGAAQRAAGDVLAAHGEHQPLDAGTLGDADVEAELADGALVDLGLVALADELAEDVLLRADDVPDAGRDFAGE